LQQVRKTLRRLPLIVMNAPTPNSLCLAADFDPSADVLYVSLGSPRPDEVADQIDDILLRVGLDDDQPSGVTVLGYRADGWPQRSGQLAAIAASHLGTDTVSILKAIAAVTHS
jgi:hypothetical protein